MSEDRFAGSNPTPGASDQSLELMSIPDYCRWALLRYAASTVARDRRSLKYIQKAVGNLDDQNAVLAYLQQKQCSVGTKQVMLLSYLRWLKYRQIKPLFSILDYYATLERLRPRKLARIPSYDVARAVIFRCKMQTRNLMLLILNTGLRFSEALNLRWSQVDLIEGKIVMEQSEKRSEGSIIPLNEEAKKALLDQKQRFTGNHPTVFKINVRTIQRNLQRARRVPLDGAELVCPKNLRHLFATRLYLRTRDLVYVQRMLRHRSILTTQKYVHYITDRKDYDVRVVEASDVETIKLLLSQGYDVALNTGKKIYLRRLRE